MKRWSPQQDSHWTINIVFGSQAPKLEILATIITLGNVKISKPYGNSNQPGQSHKTPPLYEKRGLGIQFMAPSWLEVDG
jgi:hypothetical protein